MVDYPDYPDGDLYCDDDGYDEWEDFNREDEEEFWAEVEREDLEESDYYEDDEEDE